jgi:hypothetical protein
VERRAPFSTSSKILNAILTMRRNHRLGSAKNIVVPGHSLADSFAGPTSCEAPPFSLLLIRQ